MLRTVCFLYTIASEYREKKLYLRILVTLTLLFDWVELTFSIRAKIFLFSLPVFHYETLYCTQHPSLSKTEVQHTAKLQGKKFTYLHERPVKLEHSSGKLWGVDWVPDKFLLHLGDIFEKVGVSWGRGDPERARGRHSLLVAGTAEYDLYMTFGLQFPISGWGGSGGIATVMGEISPWRRP